MSLHKLILIKSDFLITICVILLSSSFFLSTYSNLLKTLEQDNGLLCSERILYSDEYKYIFNIYLREQLLLPAKPLPLPEAVIRRIRLIHMCDCFGERRVYPAFYHSVCVSGYVLGTGLLLSLHLFLWCVCPTAVRLFPTPSATH